MGIGTGPNLRYYDPGRVSTITGIDPNPFMVTYLRQNAQELGWGEDCMSWVEGDAETAPLPEASFEAVVCTLVLCSVRDVPALLQHVKCLLRPGGQLVFIEHTISPKVDLRRLSQFCFNPLQQLLADGCHLTRDPLPAIEAAGFTSVDAKRFEVAGSGLIALHVAGVAVL